MNELASRSTQVNGYKSSKRQGALPLMMASLTMLTRLSTLSKHLIWLKIISNGVVMQLMNVAKSSLMIVANLSMMLIVTMRNLFLFMTKTVVLMMTLDFMFLMEMIVRDLTVLARSKH